MGYLLGIGSGCAFLSEKLEELTDGQPGVANKRAECPHGQLFVLWHREIHADSGFDEDKVAAHLSQRPPARPLERARGLAPGDVGQSAHV